MSSGLSITPRVWNTLEDDEQQALLARPTQASQKELAGSVAKIIEDVQKRGDEAVAELTKRFDGVELKALELEPKGWDRAVSSVKDGALQALEQAAANIRAFHTLQLPQELKLEVQPGIECMRRFTPFDAVGLYVPGGSAPLCSTVLMLGIPASIAGVPMRILATPPRKDGSVDPHVLAAAKIAQVQRVFVMGGAQAIAAMAYGTASVPSVQKIFGPGNKWVTEAKVQCARDVRGAALDMPAGPSEVLVIADDDADPELVASDLLSQAEHDPESQVILIAVGRGVAKQVAVCVEHQLATLPRREIATASLAHARFIEAPSVEEAVAISNAYAPEHLILQVRQPHAHIDTIRHAGSVFLGPWTPESVGDYASGTNHVLPTYGYAQTHSGLGVEAFGRFTTYQSLTPQGLKGLAKTVECLAKLEQLDAHRLAVVKRRERLEQET